MRKIIHRLTVSVIAVVLFLFFVSSASAVSINAATTGLSSPTSTITFSEIFLTPIPNPADPAFPFPQPIGTAYSGLGVTFSANVGYATETMYSPAGPNFTGAAAVNFSGDGHWLITFNTLVNEAAFAYASDLGTTTFTAMLNGAMVEQFSADTDFGPDVTNNIFGFQNILFDQVQIDAGPGQEFGNGIDNLQFSAVLEPTAVPEPSTLILFGIGAVSLWLIGRKKEPPGSSAN